MKLRSLLVAASVSVLALVAPSVASAASGISASNVTAPANGAKFVSDNSAGSSPHMVTFSGTAVIDSASNTVDVRCYRRAADDTSWIYTDIDNDVATDDVTGDWSTTVDVRNLGNTCLVRAVDHTSSPTNLDPFTGPTVYFAYTQKYTVSGGPNAGAVYGWYAQAGQSGAYNDFGSPHGQGIYDSHLYTGANLRASSYLWYWSAGLYGAAGHPFDGKSGLMVDGNYGWLPEALYSASINGSPARDMTGFTGIDVTFAHDPATGAINVVESHPVLRCNAGADVLVPPVSCTSLVSTGVRFLRTTTFNADGREIRLVDTYRSVDGAAHTVKAQYYDAHDTSTTASFSFPWVSSGAYATPVASQAFTLPPSGPWSYFVRGESAAPDGDLGAAQGVRVISSKPTAFIADQFDSKDLVHLHEFSVPAAGDFVLQHGFALGTQRSVLDTASAKFTDLFVKPSLAITTPVAGSEVTTTPVTVAGTVSDNVGVTSLTVNGVAVTPVSGTFSTKLSLTASPSTITVVAKDAAGNETTATATVTFKALTFTGTSGKDNLKGNALANTLNGLDGDDTIDCGAGGKDTANGGAGNDTITCVEPYASAKANADTINCGAGTKDVAIVDPFDRVLGCEKVTRVWKGTPRRDTYRPSKVSNDRFELLGGNDQVTCAGGSDVVLAGAGNDAVNCFDAGSNRVQRASRDTVNCGAGRKDVAIVDAYDKVIGCEKVVRRP